MSNRLLDVACNKCSLHHDAIHVKVASRGSEKPFILFVGEAPGKCLTPGQFVYSSESEVIPRRIEEIDTGDSYGGGVVEPLPQFYEGWVYEIDALGLRVQVTESHKVWVCHSSKSGHRRRELEDPQWVSAQDVIPRSDYVVVPKPQGFDDCCDSDIDISSFEVDRWWRRAEVSDVIVVNESTAFVFGLFLGDGCSSASNGSVTWHLYEGYKERWVDSVCGWIEDQGLLPSVAYTGRCINVTCYSTKLAKFFDSSFYNVPPGRRCKGSSKRIPTFVWEWCYDYVSKFLLGWHESDGKHASDLTKPRSIVTTSFDAYSGGLDLFMRLGVLPTSSHEKPGNRGEQVCHCLYVGNSFLPKLGWSLPPWNLDTHGGKSRVLLQEDDSNFYVPVSDVRREYYSGSVYDITTVDHQYNVPFIVHNSEDRKGEAFIGPAGKKLGDIMQEAGVDPAWCRWTNIVRCIPKGQHGIGVRPPAPDEVAACRDYLEAEILSANPVFIVPLGKSAIQFFLPQSTSVKGARGKRALVEFPSVFWRYNRLRRWLDYKQLSERLPVVHTASKMLQQLAQATGLGFPPIATKQFTLWPTYHPAAILHGNTEIEQHMVQDLSYLKFQVTGDASVPWDEYKTLQTIDEIKSTFEHVKQLYLTGQIPHVVSDIETTTLNIYLCPFYELLGFCIAWGSGKSVFIPFNHPESPFYNDKLSQDAIVSLTNDLFATVPLVGHNFKYDIHGFWQVGIKPQRVADDTYLASWTLFNDTSEHALEPLATRYTGMVSHKEEMELALGALPQYVPLETKYHRDDGEVPRFCIDDEQGRLYRPSHMGDINLQLVSKYCCADGDSNFRLQQVFERMLRDLGLWEAHQGLPVRAVLPVARMEHDGIRINLEMFEEATKDFECRLAEKTKWFADHGYLDEALEIVSGWLKKAPKEAKLTSDNVKRAIIYDVLGFPVRKTTNTGKPSADKEALGEFLQECLKYKGKKQDARGFYSHRIEALQTLMSFNKDNKLYTSYLKPIPQFADANSLGHCSFGIRTTDTGRFNCREPSWHIIPWHSIIKKAIEPHHPHGLILISDFAQMELRILAMVTKDPQLMQAFADGKDLHRFTASLCYDRPEDQVTKAQRRGTKSINFGVVFGRGAPAIAAQLNIPIDEAQELIDLWMRTFPAVADWIEYQHNLVHRKMEVWTSSGFRRVFQEGVFNDGELERRAQNTPIQGPAGDVTTFSMIRMQEMLHKIPSLLSILWATIHDALCFSIWPGELLPIATLAKKAMVDIPSRELSWLKIALSNDYEVGATWGELLEMEVLPEFGHVELKGPAPYFERFVSKVMNWDRPPELISSEPYIDEGDDGSDVECIKSEWNLAV